MNLYHHHQQTGMQLTPIWISALTDFGKEPYHKIDYLLGPKGIGIWKAFSWEDNTDRKT